MAKDLPLEELFRRSYDLRDVWTEHRHSGPRGGDPTLRHAKNSSLSPAHQKRGGMRPCTVQQRQFRRKPSLAQRTWRGPGWSTVAFHVDMTQQRRGISRVEIESNQGGIHRGALEGCGLSVMSTPFRGMPNEISKLAALFVANSDIGLSGSFQSELIRVGVAARGRSDFITPDKRLRCHPRRYHEALSI